MPDRLTRGDFERFAKQKGLARPSRVMAGGLRAVYRHPDQVRLVEGYDVNGSREPSGAEQSTGRGATVSPSPEPAESSEPADSE